MFAIMSPSPIFTFDTTSLPSPAPSVTTTTTTPLKHQQYHQQPKYRPSVSSPLSSSPIRASSYSPPASPPEEPTENFSFFPQQNQQQRQIPRDTQSSPLSHQPSSATQKTLFRFASRTPRPNPVVQKREEARESRRKLFLKNVRERADDRAWDRRGGDQEVLRLEWSRLNAELRQQKEAELAVFGTDADIEDAMELLQGESSGGGYQQRQRQREPRQAAESIDDMMVDAIAREEEAEIEALLSFMPPEHQMDRDGDRDMDGGGRPESVYFSDDDDYDALFMELSQQETTTGGTVSNQDTEMS